MSKTVLFFPGQASQYVGMARDLFEASQEVQLLYKLATEEIGENIATVSFEGPPEKLTRTRFTQPAILLHSLAVLKLMGDRIPQFDYACGHSLGEYGALAVTGALSYEDAVRAVVKRAALMEEACVKNPGTMAAIVAMPADRLDEVCRQASDSEHGVVIPANYNSKMQVAISGDVDAVTAAVELAKEAGAKRAIMLQVGGAFHSPLMEPAREGLEKYLQDIEIRTPNKPVIANVTAEPVTDPDEIRRLLVAQVTAPVRWSQTMSWLKDNGADSVFEIGPGAVLTGLAKRDMRPARSVNLDKLKDVREFTAVSA